MKSLKYLPALLAVAAAAFAQQASAAAAVNAEKIYGSTCVACHGSGMMGAPKLGDKAAWAPRAAKGKEALYTNAVNGFKMMPPRGGNGALKDAELKAVVDYMLAKAK